MISKKLFAPKTAPELTLLEIFKPMYILLSINGIFPFNLKFETKHKCKIIHRTLYINGVYALSINLVITILMVLHIQGIITSTEGDSLSVNDVITTEVNYILEVFNMSVFSVVTYYCAFCNRYNYVSMLNTLAGAWVEIPNSKNDILKKFKQRVLGTFVCIALMFIIQTAVNWTRPDDMWKKILVALSCNYPQMIQYTVLGFYYVLITMVIALIMKIEEHLKSAYVPRQNLAECFTKAGNKPSTTSIHNMEIIFVKACEVTRKINDAFEAPILITAMMSFHSMVSEAHIIYHGAIVHQSLVTHEVINCSLWIVYQVVKIIVLAYSGHLLKVEIFRLGQTLHNIPVEKHDMRTLLEIQHFSTLMSYQATELTVYGFFPLDATLLFQVIASAAMYLVILVQFDRVE